MSKKKTKSQVVEFGVNDAKSPSKNGKPKMNSAKRKIEIFISEENILANIETWMRAQGFIQEGDDVVKINIDYTKKKNGVFPLSYTLKKKNERMKLVEGHV